MKYVILTLCIATTSMPMQPERPEPYTGCRYTYFLEHKKLPAEDYDLYEQFIQLFTFLNAVAHEFGRSPSNLIMLQGGQTRQGLYLTSSTPPGIITPWGKRFTFIIDSENTFGKEEETLFWQQVKKYIVLGDCIKERTNNRASADIYPVLSFNETQLPTPILRPYEEFAHAFPITKRTSATWTCNALQNKIFNHLDKKRQTKKMNLQSLCVKTIKKHNLDISGLPEDLQKMITK